MLDKPAIEALFNEVVATGHTQSGSPTKHRYIEQAAEFVDLVADIAGIKPAIGLEIGMGGGGSHCVFRQIVSQLFITVDRRNALAFGREGDARAVKFGGWACPQTFGETSLVLLGCPSESPQTLTLVKMALAGQSLDFLYIDGNHDAPVPEQDFETYVPLVRPGGYVGMHDTVRIAGPAMVLQQVLDGRWPNIEHMWTEYNSSLFRKAVEVS